MKLYPRAKTPIKSSTLHPLSQEDKCYNKVLFSRRIKVQSVFAKVKVFKMISTTYRNRKKRLELRMNLIAGIINFEGLDWIRRKSSKKY